MEVPPKPRPLPLEPKSLYLKWPKSFLNNFNRTHPLGFSEAVEILKITLFIKKKKKKKQQQLLREESDLRITF